MPDFKPSRSLEEASSLNEALGICASYQIKGDQNASGYSKPARVVVLVPWMRCLETTLKRFPAARSREDLLAFFRALQIRHDGVIPADSEVIDVNEMNYVMARILDHLSQPASTYSPLELKVIERQLPGFWMYLADSGQFLRTDPPSGKQVRRESVPSEMIQHRELSEKLPLRALSKEQKSYCKDYRGYMKVVYDIAELSEYRRTLEDRELSGGSGVEEKVQKNRLQSRIEVLQKQNQEQKKKLDQTLGSLQAKAPWFRTEYCVKLAI